MHLVDGVLAWRIRVDGRKRDDGPRLHRLWRRDVFDDGKCLRVHGMVTMHVRNVRERPRLEHNRPYVHDLSDRLHQHDERHVMHSVVDVRSRYRADCCGHGVDQHGVHVLPRRDLLRGRLDAQGHMQRRYVGP